MSNDADQSKRLKDFIGGEILTLTINGALGRSNTYSSSDQVLGGNLKVAIRKRLRELRGRYAEGPVSELEHTQNIQSLADDLTRDFAEILVRKRFRIGISQKLLNLYLKYCWALGWIAGEPPHCPFDRRIIEKLKLKANWTEIDSVEEYRALVEAARQAGNNSSQTIASWELEQWGANGDDGT